MIGMLIDAALDDAVLDADPSGVVAAAGHDRSSISLRAFRAAISARRAEFSSAADSEWAAADTKEKASSAA